MDPITHNGIAMPAGFRPRVPVAGCIKIGSVAANNGPVKLDHFRYATPSATGKNGFFADHPDFTAENAAHPKTVPIEFVSDDPEVNLELGREMGGRGTVLCRGGRDGSAERRVKAGKLDPAGEFTKVADGTCGDECPYAKNKQCKIGAILRFRIPGHTPIGQVWQFRSHGWNTAQDLLGAMGSIKAITGGTLQRIPLELTIYEQRRSPVVGGARQSTTFYSVGLGFRGEEEDLLNALERAAKLKTRYQALNVMDLEAQIRAQGQTIGHEDDAEAAAVAAEFFSENDKLLEGGDSTAVEAQAGGTEGGADASPSPGEKDDPSVSAPEARTDSPAVEAPARVERPAAAKAGKPMSSSQRNMIRLKAQADNGIPVDKVERWLAARPDIVMPEATKIIQRLMSKDQALVAEMNAA